MKVINANQFQCLFCYHVFKFMSEAEKCLSKMFPPGAKVKIPEKKSVNFRQPCSKREKTIGRKCVKVGFTTWFALLQVLLPTKKKTKSRTKSDVCGCATSDFSVQVFLPISLSFGSWLRQSEGLEALPIRTKNHSNEAKD